jgi:hypothetical protein
MDIGNLKKRLSTYRTEGGYLKGVDDELLVDILAGWESWQGASKEFYTALGTSHTQMATLMSRAKKLKRDGVMPSSEFKEIRMEESGAGSFVSCQGGMVLRWQEKHIIEFSTVDCLLDFLKRAS